MVNLSENTLYILHLPSCACVVRQKAPFKAKYQNPYYQKENKSSHEEPSFVHTQFLLTLFFMPPFPPCMEIHVCTPQAILVMGGRGFVAKKDVLLWGGLAKGTNQDKGRGGKKIRI